MAASNEYILDCIIILLMRLKIEKNIDFHIQTERQSFYYFRAALDNIGVRYTIEENAISWTLRLKD